MINSKKEPTQAQNEQVGNDILTAFHQGDISKVLCLGFENFMHLIFDHPISFQTFLGYTSSYLDHLILDISQKEALRYVGGKLTM